MLEQAATVPLAPEMVLDPLRTSDDVEVFEVFYTSLDHLRIAAWYCRPARRKGRTPAIIFLPGYQMDPPIPKEWARRGYSALSVAPRGKLRSLGRFNPGYPNLLTHNIVDRHTYAYRGFYVDCWRGRRLPALPPGGRPGAHRRDREQPGRRPHHHHRGHAARRSAPPRRERRTSAATWTPSS